MISRRAVLALWLLGVAVLAYAPALLGVAPDSLPTTGDALGAFAPWHEFARAQLRQNGVLALWNPHVYGGVPFAANGQSALFYPPTWLYFLLPESLALWLLAVLHTWFLMLGGAFLGRTLGLPRRACLLLALLLGLGNATPAHFFGGHLTFLPARSFWPWQAAFLLRILRGEGKESPRDAIALAACLELGLAAGAPQIWLFGVLFCAAIIVFWAIRAFQDGFAPAQWPWRALGLALVLAVLWCAPVILTLRELKSWSSHGEMLSFAQVSEISATPRSLFRLLLNNFFGGNSPLMWSLPSNYGEDGASVGLAACLLALGTPFFAPTSRLCRALWVGCALVLLLALGDATPLYHALYNHVAFFQIIRVPARWLELWAFGAAILAAISFDSAGRNPSRTRPLWRFWALGAVGCLLLGAGVQGSAAPWQNGANMVRKSLDLPPARGAHIAADLQSDALLACVLGALALGILAWTWRRDWTGKAHFALLLLALCGEPLANFWLGTRITPSRAVQKARIPASLIEKYRPGQRWIVRAPFQQLGATLPAGIDALNGYEPFGSAPFFDFAGAAQKGAHFAADFQPQKMNPLWRVMGASHVLWKPYASHQTLRGFRGQTIAKAGQWRLNSLEDGLRPWPRSYLTRQIVPAADAAALEVLQTLAAQPFIGAPPAVVPLGTVPLKSVPLPWGKREISREIAVSANLRVFQIVPAADSLWVQNEVMAPGWRAYVDDRPAPIFLANGIFRGVFVARGARKITLVLNSQTLRFALFLGLVGFAVAAFGWISRSQCGAQQPQSGAKHQH